MTLLVLLGCPDHQHTSKSDGATGSQASRLHQVELSVGMERHEVEEQIASLLSRPKQYSPYGNNLRGGIVRYRDGDCVLQVIYKAGATAPWVETPDGSRQHLPPIDETVLEYKIEKIPNKEP